MWEFSWDHAVHVYNCPPLKHLEWQTPYQVLTGRKSDISHFQVFRCGVYVYLPEEVRKNKMSPKSETIVYLGQPAGYKGYCFYWLKTQRIFIVATAVFNETYFSHCPDGKQQRMTELGDQPPHDDNNGDNFLPNDFSKGNALLKKHNYPKFAPETGGHPSPAPPSENEAHDDPDKGPSWRPPQVRERQPR